MANNKLPSKIILLLLAVVFLNYPKPLAAEYIPLIKPEINLFPIYFGYANSELWSYLRRGLNYLESPMPLLPPESVAPEYLHPDSKGFGSYGFSPEAYQDVQRLYPFFKQYTWQDIMRYPKLYELANQAFADWLLNNLVDYLPKNASRQEIFKILHQAWNLGLSGFKNGRKVIASRTKRAKEFISVSSWESNS